MLRHLFACGHHFKGPHDGFGKDAKFMPKTAERHQKARIATTHNLYHFNTTNLPCPRSNVKASDVIASLPRLSPPLLAPLDESRLPNDWAAVLNVTAPAAGSTCLPCNPEPPLTTDVTPPPPTDLCTAATPNELEGLDGLELDDVNARPTVAYHEEDADSEPEDTSAGDFDFEFDEIGCRIRREEQVDDVGHVPSPASSAAASAAASSFAAASSSAAAASSSAPILSPPPPQKAMKHARTSRVITTIIKSAGGEEHAG